MTAPTLSELRSWNAEALRSAGAALDDVAATVEGAVRSATTSVDGLDAGGGWRGVAQDAATIPRARTGTVNVAPSHAGSEAEDIVSPSGTVYAPMAFFGTYLEVTPPSRLVWTNEDGGESGPVTTVTFEEEDGRTLLVMHELHASKEALDAAGTGAADATVETFAQLDELLVTLGATTGHA